MELKLIFGSIIIIIIIFSFNTKPSLRRFACNFLDFSTNFFVLMYCRVFVKFHPKFGHGNSEIFFSYQIVNILALTKSSTLSVISNSFKNVVIGDLSCSIHSAFAFATSSGSISTLPFCMNSV